MASRNLSVLTAPGEVGRLASRDLDGIAQQGSPAPAGQVCWWMGG